MCFDGINSYSCDCDLGYTSELCDIRIDYCERNPCLNDGTCNSYIGFYGCNCPDGFTGSECEINIDDCSQNPCENNGTCTDEVRNTNFIALILYHKRLVIFRSMPLLVHVQLVLLVLYVILQWITVILILVSRMKSVSLTRQEALIPTSNVLYA